MTTHINKKYISKALKDPYYKETYRYLGEQYLAPAGFLCDENHCPRSLLEIEKENFLFSSQNIKKIIRNIQLLTPLEKEHIKSQGKCYALLSTGSFNPVHEGHIKMIELAAKSLLEKGMITVGGYLSASHDKYVFTKDSRFQVTASERIFLCDKIIQNHSLLMTDSWEALQHNYPINFTDVIRRFDWLLNLNLKDYLVEQFGVPIEIEAVYVFGGDNYCFMDAFVSKGICVCVPRSDENLEQYQNKRQKIIDLNMNSPSLRIFISQPGKEISSTQIRNNDGLILKKINNNENPIDNFSFPYLIRDDSELSTQAFKLIPDYQNKINNFKIKIIKEFSNYFKHIEVLNVEDQRNTFKNETNKKVINLDTWTSLKNEEKLRVSRIFNIFDAQIYSHQLFFEDKYQLTNILNSSFDEYILVDDDIATGFTVKTIIDKLSPKKCIEAISLNPQKNFYDIVDMRDFIFGSKYGGLVCLNPFSGQTMRLPYVFPFVNLYSRAKIKFGREIELSHKIIDLNIDFFMDTDLKVNQLNPDFQNLAQFLHIDSNMPVQTMLELIKKSIKLKSGISM